MLELRDKIGLPSGAPAAAVAATAPTAPWRGQVREALVGLGWSAKQADDAVDRVAPRGRRRQRRVRPAARGLQRSRELTPVSRASTRQAYDDGSLRRDGPDRRPRR